MIQEGREAGESGRAGEREIRIEAESGGERGTESESGKAGEWERGRKG